MSAQAWFDLIITGHHSPNTDLVLVQDILKLVPNPSPQLEAKLLESIMLKSDRFTLCPQIEIKDAMQLQKRLASLAVSSEVHPAVQPEAQVVALELYTCDTCGNEQPKADQALGQLDVCKVCGSTNDDLSFKQALPEIAQVEPLRQEVEKSKAISNALKQAKYQEERRLREEALRNAVPAPAQFAKILMGVVGSLTALVGLVVVYYLTYSQEPIPTQPIQTAALYTKPSATGSNSKQDSAKAENKQANLAANLKSEPEIPTSSTTSAQLDTDKSVDNKPTPELLAQKISQPTDAQVQAPNELQVPSEKFIQAVHTLEDFQQLQPQSGVASRTLDVDRIKLQQAFNNKDQQAIVSVLDSVQRPYAHSLLLLELATWQVQQGETLQAQQSLENMRKSLAETRDIDQQVLIAGALSKAYLLLADSAKADSYLDHAISKAGDVPKRSFHALLLVQLANEQALLGNTTAARKLLKLAEPLLLPTTETTNTAKLSQLISLYTLMKDFDEAKSRLPQLDDPNKREALTALIGQLETQAN